jgi:hypothetical protein
LSFCVKLAEYKSICVKYNTFWFTQAYKCLVWFTQTFLMDPFVPDPLPLSDIDWEAQIPLIGKASRVLARYDGVLYGVPNPYVLLSPLTTQEAVLSSRIEGTQATLGEVLKFEAGEEIEEQSRRRDIYEIMK